MGTHNTRFLLGLSLAVGVAFTGTSRFNPVWRQCKRDAECVIIQGACNEPQGVNRRSAQVASDFYSEIRPMTECKEPIKEAPLEAVCRYKTCATEPITAPME